MKIHGKKITGSNYEIVVIPRPEKDIVFKASAVLDYDPFDKLCVAPEPPMITKPGGARFPDLEDEDYLKRRKEYSERRFNWLIITSIAGTEGLEWETINVNDPTTWNNFDQEMKSSGFTQVEVNRIVQAVFIANSLDEKKLEEARKSFLASQEALQVTK